MKTSCGCGLRMEASPGYLNHPAARLFIERQRIQMPAYKDVLTEQDIDRLVAYIMWIRERDSSP